jgi:hypothetical protein
MNIKKNRLGFTALVVSSVMVLSACNGAGGSATYTEDQIEDKIVAAFEAMEDVETVRSNIAIEGTAGTETEQVAFDVEMGIGQEILDKEEMLFNADFDMSGNVTYNETNVGFSLALVIMQDAIYANLGDITGLDEDPNAAMFLPMLQGYMNQWWSFELPEGGLAGLGLPEDADIAAQQEELMEILKNADFFESVELVGVEKIGGERAEKFAVKLSEEGVISYMKEVTAMTEPGAEITDEEIAEVKEVLEGLELETMVWITDSGYVGGMSIDVTGTIEDEIESVDIDVSIMVEYMDFNKNINIEAPADATEFDLGGFGLGGAMMTDPAMVDAGGSYDYGDASFDY